MKIRFVVITVVLVVVLAVAITSFSGQNSSAQLKRTTIIEAAESPKAAVTDPATIKAATDFVQKAAIGGMFEVESSKIALDESANENVKKFAQMMVDDHTKANAELRATIDSSSVDKANVPTALDEKHAAVIEKLKTTNGADFDKLYIAEQKKAHAETVALFKNYAASGKDRALNNFAVKTLPTLEEHKKHVNAM